MSNSVDKSAPNMMDANLLYIISLFGCISIFIALLVAKLYVSSPQSAFVKYVWYPLAVPRLGITRIDIVVFVITLSGNIIVILLPEFFSGWIEIQKRAALAALVNLVPLSLGGRGVLIDWLNMPQRWQRSLHIIIGILVFLEALSHIIIATALRPKPGLLGKSGYIVSIRMCYRSLGKLTYSQASGLLAGVIMVTIPFVRRCLGQWFLLSHRAIYLGSLAVLLWHVLQTTSTRGRLLLWLSGALWLFTTIFRVVRVSRYSTVAQVEYTSDTPDAVICTVRLARSIKVHPGCHFYLYFPQTFLPLKAISEYNLFQSFTAMVLWHNGTEKPRFASSLSFLLSRHGTRGTAISQLSDGAKVLLDGPYGENHALERRENVILVAKGIGIAGVLHYALDLAIRRDHDNSVTDKIQSLRNACGTANSAERERYDKEISYLRHQKLFRDATRKVVIFWLLERNAQMDWVQRQMAELQGLDPLNRLFVVCCGYNRPFTGFAPFKTSAFWICKQPNGNMPFDELIASSIKEERSRQAGRMAVLVCGDHKFRRRIRNAVLECLGEEPVQYIESDYQPRCQVVGLQEIRTRQSRSTELRQVQAVPVPERTYSVASASSLYSTR